MPSELRAVGVLGISESLNKTATAEGVEDAAQAKRLRLLGCSEAQGYSRKVVLF